MSKISSEIETEKPKARKNKFTIIALVTVFVLPVVLAKLALENDWFNKSATNRGQLLAQPIDASTLLTPIDKHEQGEKNTWKLMMTIPEVCDQACENAVLTISQVRQAVGRHMERVDAVYLVTDESDVSVLANIKENQLGILLNQDNENVNKVFKSTGIDAIFITDTLHNVVLKYPNTPDTEQAIMDGRDVLADLRKLLKLSRIG
jgi:hypothetical protein